MSEKSEEASYRIEPLREAVLAVLEEAVTRRPDVFALREVKATRQGEWSYALDRAGEDELGLLLTVSRRYHPDGEVIHRRTIGGKARLCSFEAIWAPSCTPARLSRWVQELEGAESTAWARG